MTNTINILGNEVSIKEYDGQRVVTFKDIDLVHQRPEGTARKRFNDNKKHFVEGIDYFKVPYNEDIESPPGGRSIFDEVANIEGYRGIDYSGFIYLTQDTSTKYWKIGRSKSKRNTEKRLNLARTTNLENYKYFSCLDTLKANKLILERLVNFKVKNSWYDCELSQIIETIQQVIKEVEETFEPREYHKGGYHGDITLVTESGYLMLVKSFTDDLSWEVQRCLVNTYFKAKELVKDTSQNPCAYAQAKDRIALWKRNVSNPLIERLIVLTGMDDFVSAYACAYNMMKKAYGFDMNKAKFDYCQKYNVAYENCSVIDCVGDNAELRSAFEQCVSRKIRELSEDRVAQAEEFAAYSDEIIRKAMQASQMLNAQITTADNECNCLE